MGRAVVSNGEMGEMRNVVLERGQGCPHARGMQKFVEGVTNYSWKSADLGRCGGTRLSGL